MQTVTRTIGAHQAHVMMGCRAYDIHDRRRMPLYLLNNILGGPGLNSRLNLILRERHGLVYTVESTLVSYSDTGVWSIYFGCDHKDVQRCIRLIRKELDRFVAAPLSAARLTAAKRQIKGQIALSADNHENFALDFGKAYLQYGWENDPEIFCQRIDAITAEEIQAVAKELFCDERLLVMIYE